MNFKINFLCQALILSVTFLFTISILSACVRQGKGLTAESINIEAKSNLNYSKSISRNYSSFELSSNSNKSVGNKNSKILPSSDSNRGLDLELRFPFDNSKSPINEILSSAHTGALYNFTDKPDLWEGSDIIYNDLGSKVIKLWFSSQYREVYTFNHQWEAITNLVELAKSDYYKRVFNMPYRSYILETHGFKNMSFAKNMSASQIDSTKQEMYDLAKYLLTTYKNSGKIFVLQNWEGDNMMASVAGKARGEDIDDAIIEGMISWVNARQDGIDMARKEIGMNNVYVFGAMEVNIITNRSGWWLNNDVKAVDRVVPFTHCDLYSYSDWETLYSDAYNHLKESLQYLKNKAPSSKYFGDNNIMLGEFGCPENVHGLNKHEEVVKNEVKAALDFGCQYVLYWQLYDNVPQNGYVKSKIKPKILECQGNWLIRCDGSKSPVWSFFKELYKMGTWKK